MKLKKLKAKLGEDYDSNWMSLTRPVNASQVIRNRPKSDVRKDLETAFNHLNVSSEIYSEIQKVKKNHSLSRNISELVLSLNPEETKQITDIFRQWISQKAECPVHYQWEDLGTLFWPRWIKVGRCSNDLSKPCSFPPGMNCIAGRITTLYVLRWHCRSRFHGRTHRGSLKRNIKCRWLKVPYPVTSGCFCSC